MVIGLNAKAWYTFKIRELSMDWRTPVPPIHTKCTMPLGLNLVNLLIFGNFLNFYHISCIIIYYLVVLTYSDFFPSLSKTSSPFSTSSLQPYSLFPVLYEAPYATAYRSPSFLSVQTPSLTDPLDSLVAATDTKPQLETSKTFQAAFVSESPISSTASQTAPTSSNTDLPCFTFPYDPSVPLSVTHK